MEAREKVEKSRNMVFFSMFCGSGGSRSRLAKTAGSHLGKNCTPLLREEHFEVKMVKTLHCRTAFGS
jgi:hypothetical protein